MRTLPWALGGGGNHVHVVDRRRTLARNDAPCRALCTEPCARGMAAGMYGGISGGVEPQETLLHRALTEVGAGRGPAGMPPAPATGDQ